ncbi:MAG: MFS transporter [candidate division KSB1 bacterium]|nr:MFS transporter [candidate division KSB1 bacterium]MDZ7340067.1 MFS transporter [candidate division KSB1 bacterium]
MNDLPQKPKLIATISWIIYDFANTIYSMNVVTMYFSTWIVVDLSFGDSYVSFANSISMLLVAITLPILGEISDRFQRRMPLLIAYTLSCILFTALIGICGQFIVNKQTMVIVAIVAFILANYSYQGGLVFYNALLPVVATERSMGRVSGYGVAIGYLGSIVGLILVLPFVEGQLFGLSVPYITKGGSVASFVPTAIFFLIFALPTFFYVKDAQPIRRPIRQALDIKHSFKKVWDGLSNTRKYPGVTRFLVSKFFYEEAIETIIIFMAVYAQKVMHFSKEGTTKFFIMVIPSAIIGSALFGILTDHFGPKKTLTIVLSGWIACLLLVIITLKLWIFWLTGALVGVFMGATWTSARPLLISLVPNEMLGEFFGLYSFSGKIAAIVGPLVWAATVSLFAGYGNIIKYKAAIVSLTLLILIGLIIFQKVPDRKRTSISTSN